MGLAAIRESWINPQNYMVKTDWIYTQSQLSGRRFEEGEVPKNSVSLSFHCEEFLAPKTELKIGLCRIGIVPAMLMGSEEWQM